MHHSVYSSNSLSTIYLSCFLDTFVALESANASTPMEISTNDDGEDTIVIDSDDDDEMLPAKTDFQTWYTEFLAKLERRYPEAFDLSVKAALSAKSNSTNRRQALKLALGECHVLFVLIDCLSPK